MSTAIAPSSYTCQDVQGKGRGLVASKDIARGTRILSEEPIITIGQGLTNPDRLRASVSRQVDALSPEQHKAFLTLHNRYSYDCPAEQYSGIVRTVSLPIEADGIDGGIFLEACRINHACDNNAQKSWNENIKRHTVHALRDIAKGEEITVYYLAALKNRQARREALQAKFGFACSCGLCSQPPAQSRECDRRLDEISRLDRLVGQYGLDGILRAPLRLLRYVDQQVRLYHEHGPDDNGLPRAFFDAAQICIANGDLARARVFAGRAVAGWRVLGGGDSPRVLQHEHLTRDPSRHMLHGLAADWKTAVDEVPRGLEASEFEDWLWKRDRRRRPGQPADLRNHTTFPALGDLPFDIGFDPGFADSPLDKGLDPNFYESGNGMTQRPKRHWCFLAEIVDFFLLPIRLQLDVKDVQGVKLPLAFYTDGRGSELARTQVHKGYTVAVLYAQSHVFVFGDPGIRHEDPAMLKIFPTSLNDLLALSDRVQQFSGEVDGIRVCHACGKKSNSLKHCGKCSLFWYCDKACQMAGWNEKGHKADCKLLKDADLRGLFFFKWDEFKGQLRFPLHTT